MSDTANASPPSQDSCPWPGQDELYISYHDNEWGVPEYNDRKLYEKLMLDGFQAGLSWITILKKRENFRQAFDAFDPEKIARYTETDIQNLVQNAGIIRHRGKIEATIKGAQAWLNIMEKGQGFSSFCWEHVNGKPLINHWQTIKDVPASTSMSARFSKNLKAAGFSFCGPVIVYAFAQAVGMVNDHLVTCPQHQHCQKGGTYNHEYQ